MSLFSANPTPRPRGHATRLALLGAVLCGWLACSASAAPAPTAEEREYQIKGAFLAKFALFTEWPANAFTNAQAPIVIGVLRPGLLGADYEAALKAQSAHGRPFALRPILRKEDLAGCHILFLNGTSRGRVASALNEAGHGPALTVGESAGFATQGGVVNFFKEAGRVRFEINPDAAERAGLKISSKLLQLARIIRDAPAAPHKPNKP